MAAEQDVFTRTLSLAVHELRTPVTVVNGYLRMVLKGQGGELTDKQRKMLEEAERSCVRISALVAQLSEVGKLESGDLTVARKDVDIAELVVEVASDMHEGEDRGVRLELQGTDRPLVVEGDRPRLAAAIGALLHATLRERGEPGVIVATCSTTANPPAVVMTIGDADTAQRLLDAVPGATATFDEWRGGVGLALPLARRVVAAHGGSIASAAGQRPQAATVIRLPLKGNS